MAAPITPNGGRPKGSPNKATANAREAIAEFVEGNVDRLNGWLDRIAEDDPKDAFNAFMSVIEYHVPKLSRSETPPSSGDVNINIINLTQQILDVLSVDQLERVRQRAITPPDNNAS